MVYPAKHFITPEEYLTLEEMAETKHEYFSLRDYLLVEQDRVAVEYFSRAKGSRKWSGQTFAERKQAISLRAVGCELPLREIYRKVELSG